MSLLRAAEIVAALGGRNSGNGYVACCPAHDDHIPSLSIQDSNSGKVLVKCFAGCSQASVIDALRSLSLWDEGPLHSLPPIRPGNPNQDKARKMWAEARRANGIAETYFRGRGITLVPPASIRECPALHYCADREDYPALLCAVQDASQKVVAVQRIYLSPDGTRKADIDSPKMSLGPVGGSAVRLGPIGEELGIAEGVETALSAMQLYGGSAWACLGSSNLSNVHIPPEVRRLLIYGDNGEAGERMAISAAEIHSNSGLEVRLLFPEPRYGDFNDLLQDTK